MPPTTKRRETRRTSASRMILMLCSYFLGTPKLQCSNRNGFTIPRHQTRQHQLHNRTIITHAGHSALCQTVHMRLTNDSENCITLAGEWNSAQYELQAKVAIWVSRLRRFTACWTTNEDQDVQHAREVSNACRPRVCFPVASACCFAVPSTCVRERPAQNDARDKTYRSAYSEHKAAAQLVRLN